jgi:hypothetical protein
MVCCRSPDKETSFLFLALHSHVHKITHEDPEPAESGLDADASHLEAELLNAIWRHPSVQNCSHLRYFCRCHLRRRGVDCTGWLDRISGAPSRTSLASRMISRQDNSST